MTALLVVGVLAVLLVAIGIWSPWRLVVAMAILAPWQGLDVDAGLRVTAYRVAVVAFVAVSVMRLAVAGGAPRRREKTGLFFGGLYLYGVVWTLGQIPFLPQMEIAGGEFRSPALRAVSQCVMFLLDLAPVLFLPVLLRSTEELKKLGSAYVASVVVLVCIGWGQMAAWYATGENPLPIGYLNSLLGGQAPVYEGVETIEGTIVRRMNSFGGEPKGLGQSVAFALLLIQIFGSGRPDRRRTSALVWALLAVSLVATASASGVLVWLSGSLLILALQPLWLSHGLSRVQVVTRVVLAIGLATFTLLTSWFEIPAGSAPHLRALSDRVVGRELFEDFDAAVIGFLVHTPWVALFGVGLGNVHLYATSHLADSAWRYAGGTPFVAKSGLLRLLSELGIVGLSLFLVAVAGVVQPLRRGLEEVVRLRGLWLCGALGAWCFLLRGGYLAPQAFMALGACAAAIAVASRLDPDRLPRPRPPRPWSPRRARRDEGARSG